MSPWLDNRSTTGRGPATHALVIGVSSYDGLTTNLSPRADRRPSNFGLRRVGTPALAALRFAQWLADPERFRPAVPLATIRLLLAPSAKESQHPAISALDERFRSARTLEVQAALTQWRLDCTGDEQGTALLYVAGHGITHSATAHTVLLQDFPAPDSPLDHSLDVDNVHRVMSRPGMPRRQFYFVDLSPIRPRAFVKYAALGSGRLLPEPDKSPQTPPPPVYAGTSPGFAQELMACLNSRQHTEISAETLVTDLGRRVVTGGRFDGAVLRRAEASPRPAAPLRFTVRSNGIVLPVELRDEHRRLLGAGLSESPLAFEVPPGELSVLLRLPDGSCLAESAREEVRFDLDPDAFGLRPHPVQSEVDSLPAGWALDVLSMRGMREFSSATPVDSLARLTRGRFGVTPEVAGPGTWFLRAVGPLAAPLTVALPAWSGRVQVTFEMGGAAPRVLAAPADEHLLPAYRYLAGNQPRQAALLLEHKQGEEPTRTVLTGYVLARLGRIRELSADTMARLRADWPWLTDAAVLAGEHAATDGDHQLAMRHFAETTRLGLPVFTDGFSILVSRLRQYLANDEIRRELGQDWLTGAARLSRRLDRWSPYVDFSAPTLTVHSSPQLFSID
ncbi:hypothetical protein [Kutzneria albida]|uniref:Uncharacterized protein n=1 Tax=Kutzneria albida DSM 43870 TaxID=1449976 RepID=W5W497_9PSEU|nr:hypothetical protein [Kutzneria albida]AHH96063.1 hypothetical protein KALB_2695 [Kutzneria albida DSM 43870]